MKSAGIHMTYKSTDGRTHKYSKQNLMEKYILLSAHYDQENQSFSKPKNLITGFSTDNPKSKYIHNEEVLPETDDEIATATQELISSVIAPQQNTESVKNKVSENREKAIEMFIKAYASKNGGYGDREAMMEDLRTKQKPIVKDVQKYHPLTNDFVLVDDSKGRREILERYDEAEADSQSQAQRRTRRPRRTTNREKPFKH